MKTTSAGRRDVGTGAAASSPWPRVISAAPPVWFGLPVRTTAAFLLPVQTGTEQEFSRSGCEQRQRTFSAGFPEKSEPPLGLQDCYEWVIFPVEQAVWFCQSCTTRGTDGDSLETGSVRTVHSRRIRDEVCRPDAFLGPSGVEKRGGVECPDDSCSENTLQAEGVKCVQTI